MPTFYAILILLGVCHLVAESSALSTFSLAQGTRARRRANNSSARSGTVSQHGTAALHGIPFLNRILDASKVSNDMVDAKKKITKYFLEDAVNGELAIHPDTMDLSKARRLVGKSFAGTSGLNREPVTAWSMDPVELTTEERADLLSFGVGFSLHHAAENGGLVYGIKDDNSLKALLVVYEYDSNREEIGPWRSIKSYFDDMMAYKSMEKDETGIPELLTNPKSKNIKDVLFTRKAYLQESIEKNHRTYGPRGRHWYVNIVAVDPDSQGKGYGRCLMTLLTRAADESNATCYLECGGTKNKAIYEKYGFCTVGESTLSTENYEGKFDEAGVEGAVKMTCMARLPNLSQT